MYSPAGIEACTLLYMHDIVATTPLALSFPANVKMCHVKYCVLIFCAIIFNSYALNCRSEGGPKEDELKNIYMNCLKQQGKNSSSREYNDEQHWKDSHRHSHTSQWERDRDDRNGYDKRNSKEDRKGFRDEREDENRSRYDRMGSSDERMNNRNDRRGSNDRMGSNDRSGSNDRMGNRNNRMGSGNDMMGRRDEQYGRTDINGRDDFPQSDEFGSDMSSYNYRSTTQSASRRYKREKRIENSGQRSQYNPNTQRKPDDSYRNEDRNNSSENGSSKDEDAKACALHCFMENLEMTGDNGMPDRFLVAHTITKDVKNEDLRDFLQESIEECFQMLDNENTEDKCEFSKNLMMCLSEKGRANCDDWKDDIKF